MRCIQASRFARFHRRPCVYQILFKLKYTQDKVFPNQS